MLMASIFRWRPQFFVSVSSTEEDCLEERRCQECGGEGSRQGDEEGGQEDRCKEVAERRGEGSRTDCGGGSCHSVGLTPKVWRIADPTRKFIQDLGIAFQGYQRLCPKPPPPGRSPLGRSVLGRASLTFKVWPSNSEPFKAVIAFTASAWLLISTNPKSFGCPVSRSVTILTRSTVPYFSNSGPEHVFRCRHTEVAYIDFLHVFGSSLAN